MFGSCSAAKSALKVGVCLLFLVVASDPSSLLSRNPGVNPGLYGTIYIPGGGGNPHLSLVYAHHACTWVDMFTTRRTEQILSRV